MTTLAKLTLTAGLLTGLAACAGPMATTTATGGQTFDQLRMTYPDLSATEFARLDDNGDGVVDSEEAMAISDEDVAGVVGEVDVRDN